MLAEIALQTMVGLRAPAPVVARLALAGADLSLAGVPVGNWSPVGASVSATVTFGPYPAPVSFDAVRLFYGAEPLIDLPRLTIANLDPGDTFTEDVFLDGIDR